MGSGVECATFLVTGVLIMPEWCVANWASLKMVKKLILTKLIVDKEIATKSLKC